MYYGEYNKLVVVVVCYNEVNNVNKGSVSPIRVIRQLVKSYLVPAKYDHKLFPVLLSSLLSL